MVGCRKILVLYHCWLSRYFTISIILFCDGNVVNFAVPAEDETECQTWKSSIDVDKLENEFVLTSAEYMLFLKNVKWTYTGNSRFAHSLQVLVKASNPFLG